MSLTFETTETLPGALEQQSVGNNRQSTTGKHEALNTEVKSSSLLYLHAKFSEKVALLVKLQLISETTSK